MIKIWEDEEIISLGNAQRLQTDKVISALKPKIYWWKL